MHADLGLPPRVIAAQMGWQLAGVSKLLEIYGHGDVGRSRRSTGRSGTRWRRCGRSSQTQL